jgi:hypothetical protein
MRAGGASFYGRRIISEGIESRAHDRSPLDVFAFFFLPWAVLHFDLLLNVRRVRLSQLSACWNEKRDMKYKNYKN